MAQSKLHLTFSTTAGDLEDDFNVNQPLHAVKTSVMARLHLDVSQAADFVVTLNGQQLDETKKLGELGCPAEPGIISQILANENVRLSCPHMAVDLEEKHVCQLQGTNYRGEEHSVWLRMMQGGYQVVDLDLPSVWRDYLNPHGVSIPLFPLIAVLYVMAPEGVYPSRQIVGIPEFADDFSFGLERVEFVFDCNEESAANAALLARIDGVPIPAPSPGPIPELRPGVPLPTQVPGGILNTGLGAELAVAADLKSRGWEVFYRGNQRRVGYDLEVVRDDQTLHVEVKSSVSFTEPELTKSEWDAAQRFGELFVLAVVDFCWSQRQTIWYVRNPAANAVPVPRSTQVFRLVRSHIRSLGTDVEFL